MKIVNTLYTYLNSLEKKQFYQYIGGLIAIVVILCGGIIFNYYRVTRYLKSEINHLNEQREEIRSILDKARLVKKEQKEIDSILAKDENFKIAGYFEDLLGKLGLSDKTSGKPEITTPTQEGNYQESILQAKFIGITMKNLTELLQEIELNKRVFSKELDIRISQKLPGTIDVTLTIGTLERKPKEVQEPTE